MAAPAYSVYQEQMLVRITAGAGGTFTGPTLKRKMRVALAWGRMLVAGTTSWTSKLTDGTNDITEAKDISAAADHSVFFWTLDHAKVDLTVGAVLTVVNVTTACAIEAYVLLVPADVA